MIFSLLTLPSFAFYKSCYEEWNDAYNDANAEYANDRRRCGNTHLFVGEPNRCLREADASYNHSVNQAGDGYYNCVMSGGGNG